MIDNKMNNSKKNKIVIFDLCGTLLNSKTLDHHAINNTLEKYHKAPWSITRKQKNKSLSMKENFPIFFGKHHIEAYNTYIDYLTKHINEISFFEYASEHLQILKYLNKQTAIITNRDNIFINALKQQNEFKQHFIPFIDAIITADDAGICKPSPVIIETAINKLNSIKISPHQVTFIGDAYADIQCALNYGCTPILFNATATDITPDFLALNQHKIKQFSSHKNIIEFFIQKEKSQQANISRILTNKKYFDL